MQLLQQVTSSQLQQFVEQPEMLLDQSVAIQIAIATHPDTPRNLLEWLTRSPNQEVAEAARLHVNWAGELVEDWETAAEEVLRTAQLEQNDRLAVYLLEFAPVPVFFLSEWVPAHNLLAGVRNPHLRDRDRLQLLERIAQGAPKHVLIEIAESSETPASILEKLIGDLDLAIRITVRLNPNCPPELVQRIDEQAAIAQDWDADPEELTTLATSCWPWIRKLVAQNPSAAATVLLQLAREELPQIHKAIAMNPASPREALDLLVDHPDMTVRQAVVENPNSSEKVLLTLRSQHSDTTHFNELIMQRENLPIGVFEELLSDRNKYYTLLKNPNLPLAILERMATYDWDELLANAAQRKPRISIEERERQVRDSLYYLVYIAKHPQVSTEILIKLLQCPNLQVREVVFVRINAPDANPQMLEQLATHSDMSVRVAVASNLNTPLTALERLAVDEDNQVRETVAANPNLPSHLLEQLATEENEVIRTAVAGNPNSTPAMLDLLSNYFEESICIAIAENPNTPINLLERIASSSENKKNLQLELALAKNPATPDTLREYLLASLQKYSANILFSLARNPLISEVEQLKYFQRVLPQLSNQVKEAIAKAPDAPVAVLELLVTTKDNYGVVVAQNPKAPTHLLRQIAAEADPGEHSTTGQNIRRWLAENPATPKDLLMQLFREYTERPRNGNPSLREIILKNSGLSLLERYRFLIEQQLVEEISQASQFLTSRPNNSLALDQVVQGSDQNARINVARSSSTPVHILEQLTKDPDEIVRQVVVQNPNLPLNCLLELTQDSSVSVRLSLAYNRSNQQTPISVLEQLAQDESEQVRARIAENSDTPIEILNKLAQDPSFQVCKTLTHNPNTPGSILELIAIQKGIVNPRNDKTSSNAFVVAIEKAIENHLDKEIDNILKVRNSQIPPEILERLSSYPTNWIRSSVAAHFNTPTTVLEHLVDDEYEAVRMVIVQNPNTSSSALERLLRQEDSKSIAYNTICMNLIQRPILSIQLMEALTTCSNSYIREALINRSDFPEDLLESCAENETESSVLCALARNQRLTIKALTNLLSKPNPEVRKVLIHHANLTSEHWQKLVNDIFDKVRIEIAAYSRAPIEILRLLASDQETEVRSKLARNPNIPLETFYQLAQDPSVNVRNEIALNHNAPASVLEQLAQDEAIEVRRAVAQNPNIPSHLREALQDLLPRTPLNAQRSPTLRGLSRNYIPSQDDLPSLLAEYTQSSVLFVRFVALRHPLTPVDTLSQAVQSSSWLERYAVAENSTTPMDICQQLAQDGNRMVRAAAKARL